MGDNKVKVVGVRFKKAGKIYYFNPDELPIKLNDGVIVETIRGIEYGEIVVEPKLVNEEEIIAPLKDVIRIATKEDTDKVEQNKNKEKDAFDICFKKIEEHGLPMKLIDVEYTFDISKIIFYFTAEGRVDFRELVKDLAAIFKTRIELRQIGVRDEAKMIGGLGCCGRPLCCTTFLGEFDPVSIRMAKDQNLSLNPTKISGICGRLMCCLKYENDTYDYLNKKIPGIGSIVKTELGEGKVISTCLLKERVTVEIPKKDSMEFSINEIEIIKKAEDKNKTGSIDLPEGEDYGNY